MYRSRSVVVSTVICFLVTSLGCGEMPPELVPVSGKVMLDGKPVTAGSLVFYPAQGNAYTKDNPSSLLQLDGSFTMKTFPFGEGISPGDYTVALSPELAQRLSLFDYGNKDKSPLTIHVPKEGLKEFLINLPATIK